MKTTSTRCGAAAPRPAAAVVGESSSRKRRSEVVLSMRLFAPFVLLLTLPLTAAERDSGRTVVEPAQVHLRSGTEREWTDFPEVANERHLERKFPAKSNAEEQTLLIRQQDVKQGWNVLLNGAK